MSEEQKPKGRRKSASRSAEEPNHTRSEESKEEKQERKDEEKAEGSASESKTEELALERTVTGGYRSTASTPEELREEALKESRATDYARTEQRLSDGGPNPYKLGESTGTQVKNKFEPDEDSPLLTAPQVGAYTEAISESDAADAEVDILGAKLTDTGAKVELNPERVSAQEKAELPRAGDPFEEATAVSPEDALTSDRNPGPGAPEMDRTGETPERPKDEEEEE